MPLVYLGISFENFDIFFAEDEKSGSTALGFFATLDGQLRRVRPTKLLRDPLRVILKVKKSQRSMQKGLKRKDLTWIGRIG